MKIYNYKGHKIEYRTGTCDWWMIQEILKREEYKINLNKGDIVLDIGGNIGVFAVYAALKGVREIYSFECDPNNFPMLVDNTKSFPNIITVPFALFKDEVKNMKFRIGTQKNPGNGSLFKRKGAALITVSTLAFNDVVNEIQPTKIKIDIEQGEYYLFNYDLDLPDSIQQIEYEIHNIGKKTIVLYNRLEKYLLSQNFTISKPKNFLINRAWFWKILCTKM